LQLRISSELEQLCVLFKLHRSYISKSDNDSGK